MIRCVPSAGCPHPLSLRYRAQRSAPLHPQIPKTWTWPWLLCTRNAACLPVARTPSPQLLELLLVLGVKRITALAVGLSVLLITHAGDQSAAERALHAQIVARFKRDQHPMAQARAMAAS